VDAICIFSLSFPTGLPYLAFHSNKFPISIGYLLKPTFTFEKGVGDKVSIQVEEKLREN